MVKGAALATLPRRLLIAAGPKREPFVYLTFDDGPHPEHTPRLLDILAEHHVPATFFLIGSLAEKYPAVVLRIAREGHTVGNHTFHHTRIKKVSVGKLMDEIRRTSNVLADITGRRSRFFRPPYGGLTPLAALRLWAAGHTVVLWNSDPRDFMLTSAEGLSDWFRAHPPDAGDIILLHDRLPYAAVVLPRLVEETRRRGLEFAAVERLHSSNSMHAPLNWR